MRPFIGLKMQLLSSCDSSFMDNGSQLRFGDYVIQIVY